MTAAREIFGLGFMGLFREPKKRKGSYVHKDQLEFYKNVEDLDGYEEQEASGNSEHYRKMLPILTKDSGGSLFITWEGV